jgi:hypothetical protein
MPAMRATERASPFFRVAEIRAACVWGVEKAMVPVAVAVRWVGGLEVMEIICAVEWGVRCGSGKGGAVVDCLGGDAVGWTDESMLLRRGKLAEEKVRWREWEGGVTRRWRGSWADGKELAACPECRCMVRGLLARKWSSIENV